MVKTLKDANQTIEMRSRLQRWNYFISEHHHIDLLLPDKEMENVFSEDDDEKEPEAFFADEDEPSYVELSRVRLHRIFNNSSFEQGGRFYGAWWQSIPKIFRKRITINEHATREFDYSNLHAAMLYAIEGLPLPDDAYVLDGFKEYRPLVKTTFFKLINAGADQKIEAPRSDALPAGWSWSELLDAVKEKHAPIAKYLHSGIGLKLQRVDSDIAETVMLRMMEKDILVLPVHDSFVTYHELQSEIRDEMVRAYKERMNTEVGIDADASFVDEWNKEAAMGVDFDAYDVVENEQTRPGYEGYQKRHVEFFRTRSNE